MRKGLGLEGRGGEGQREEEKGEIFFIYIFGRNHGN